MRAGPCSVYHPEARETQKGMPTDIPPSTVNPKQELFYRRILEVALGCKAKDDTRTQDMAEASGRKDCGQAKPAKQSG
jgi:hypothetical protein